MAKCFLKEGFYYLFWLVFTHSLKTFQSILTLGIESEADEKAYLVFVHNLDLD